MNKKLLFSVLGASALVGFTACQNDDLMSNGADGGVQTVTFSAQLPSAMTRAYGEASSITTLQYAVYPKNSSTAASATTEESPAIKGSIVKEAGTTSFSVQIDLVKGQSYDVYFWADCGKENSPYTFKGNSVTISYNDELDSENEAILVGNNENRDAFYAKADIDVSSTTSTQQVNLTRPFAQLNIGTNDYVGKADQYFPIEYVEITTKVYTTIDLNNEGKVNNEDVCEEVTFRAALPTNGKFPIDGYTYLAMDYLFVGESVSEDVTMVAYSGGKTVTNKYHVPMQMNYRTNIAGALLTSQSEWTVSIDKNFASDIDPFTWDGESVEMPTDNGDGSYSINNAAQLAGFAALVNNGTLGGDNSQTRTSVTNKYTSATFTLMADIDLGGNNKWTPIGYAYKSGSNTAYAGYSGTFNGNGYTISNLKIEKDIHDTSNNENKAIGFFGATNGATISNLTIENVDIKGCLCVAAVVGNASNTTFNNITVKGSVNIEAGCYAGVLAGKAASSSITDVKVEASASSLVRTSTKDDWASFVGGVIGYSGQNLKVENVKSTIHVIGDASYVGGIIGLTNAGDQITKCSSSGNVTAIYNTKAVEYTIGGIAGAWIANAEKDVTVSECIYTGKLTYLKSANSSDIYGTAFVNFGLVGNKHKGYETGNLVLENILSTPQQLQLLAKEVNKSSDNTFEGVNFYLGADVDLGDIENWEAIGHLNDCTFKGNFDGKDHTISNLKIVRNRDEADPINNDLGFFGTTAKGEIHNIKFHNADIRARHRLGVVVGKAQDTYFHDIEITGKVIVTGRFDVAAGIGYYIEHNISNISINVESGSYVEGFVPAVENETPTSYAGGFTSYVGKAGLTFENINSNIDVRGNFGFVGGLFGHANGNTNLNNCHYYNGQVTLIDAYNEDFAATIGGIAGTWCGTFTLNGCSSSGSMSSTMINKTQFTNFNERGLVGIFDPERDDSGHLIINN